jgi:acyl-CoA thioester hydrolase
VTQHARPRLRRDPADLAACEIPHPRPFVCDLHPEDADAGQEIPHVANTEYLRWLDGAAQLHADELGYSRAWLMDRGIMWFVARHEVDYLAEVWPRDELLVATWVRDMHRVRSWRDYVIYRPADETIVCRAATLWVLVDLETRRPTRIPAEMIAKFAPLKVPEAISRCTSA